MLLIENGWLMAVVKKGQGQLRHLLHLFILSQELSGCCLHRTSIVCLPHSSRTRCLGLDYNLFGSDGRADGLPDNIGHTGKQNARWKGTQKHPPLRLPVPTRAPTDASKAIICGCTQRQYPIIGS